MKAENIMILDKPQRIVIIHGWEGSPEGNWFPWLKGELESRGYEVHCPAMPHPDHPMQAAWVKALRHEIRHPDTNTFFVGHSLGVITILRYFETLGDNEQVGGAVFVAGFMQPLPYEVLNTFFQTPVDVPKIRQVAPTLVAINSDNDPYVPLQQAEMLRDQLGAKVTLVTNGGHLNSLSGYTEFPLVLEKLLAMTKGYAILDESRFSATNPYMPGQSNNENI